MYQASQEYDEISELRFLHRMFSYNSMPTMTYAADGSILFSNDAMEDITRRLKTSFSNIESWFTPLTAGRDPGELRKFFLDTGSETRKEQFDVSNGNGSAVTVELHVLHMSDVGPYADFFILKGRDVTAEKGRKEPPVYADHEKSLVLDHLSELVLFYDINRTVQWANRSAADFLGVEPAELIGKHCRDLWCQPPRPCKVCPMVESSKTMTVMEKEMSVKNSRIVHMLAKPVLGADGELSGIVQVVRDITEARREHDALVEAETFSRNIIDTLTAQIAVLDEDGGIISVNRAWEEFVGDRLSSPESMKNGNDLFILCNGSNKQCAETSKILKDAIRDVLDGKINEFRHEYKCCLPDVEEWYVCRITRFIGEGPPRVVISRTDVTGRKLAEKQVLDMAKFPNESPNPIVRCDRDGHILYANPVTREMMGRVGYPDDNLVPEPLLPIVQRVMKTNIPESTEMDYGPISLSLFIIPVVDSGNAIIYGVDISGKQRERAEHQRQQMLLRVLMENTRDLIFFKNRDSRFLIANQSVADYFGVPGPDDVVGTTDFDHFDHDQAQRFFEEEQEIIRTGEPIINRRERIDAPNGSVTWLSVSKHPFHDVSGAVNGTFGVNRDITKLIDAEDALRESERKYRMLIDNLPQKIFYKDRDHRFVSLNQQLARSIGLEPEEIVGKDDYAFFPKELADKYRADDRRVMENDRMEEIDEQFVDNGKEIVIRTVKSPMHDDQGNVIGILGIFWDVTEQKLHEIELNRLITALSQVSESIIVTDHNSHIIFVNPAFEQVTGYSRDEVVGKDVSFLKSGKHESEFYDEMWRVLNDGETWQGTIVNKKKNGELFEEEATISPVRNQQGEIINYVAVKRDVTQQRALEKQLNQNQKLESVGRLAAGIAHEINTPTQYVGDNLIFLRDSYQEILGVLSAFESLLPELEKHDAVKDIAGKIGEVIENADLEYLQEEIPNSLDQSEEGVRRVSEIVRAMKAFSHPGTDTKMEIDINRAIQSTVTVARNEWKYVSEVETDFADDLPTVMGFASELNQVTLNIILNAAQAISETVTPGAEKGLISISTGLTKGGVEIRIGDSGPGIPADIAARVFDPFFTTKEVGKGTGQGLAIAYDVIVNKHGGAITFESEPGKGTTFIITLPADA